MLSRTTRTPRLQTAIRRSQLPLLNLLGDVDRAIDPVGRCDSAHGASRLGSARLGRLGFASRSPSTRGLSSGVAWTRERGVYWSGDIISRTFHFAPVHFERNGSASGDPSAQGSSISGSSAVQPLQPSHLQPSLVADDFRSLIVSRKREVAMLEAALEILETAPRDKRFEDLVRKHNIQLEPFKVLVAQPEKWEDPSSLSTLEAHSPKPVLEFEPASAVEPISQIGGFSKVKNSIIKDDLVDLEPAKSSDSQPDRWWITTPLSSSKVDSTTFDRLSPDDFPSPRDPSFERLQKKRRRQELMKEHERKSRIESLNFGVAAKSVSNPREESPADSLRPNASAFLEQKEQKPHRSLADRLYEEQFGRPAPPGLKRTYPKGSFYDRCMKEKEQRERDAAAAAARVASSPFPPRSVPSPSSSSTESTASVSLQRAEAGDNSIRKNVTSNDRNHERKPGAWKCPECTYFNLATDKHCYRCQAEGGEKGAR